MTSPKMSARRALEIVHGGDPATWVGTYPDAAGARVNYARACAILAALVEEIESWDAYCIRPQSVNPSEMTEKRRRLERGEES